MELGVHLPLIDFGDGPPDLGRLVAYAERASELGFVTLAANDHLAFPRPWLDGPTALAAVVGHSGTMRLATTVALPAVRGPAACAKAAAALDHLSGGRFVLGVGPGSSATDHELAGLPFDERWVRLDEAIAAMRAWWSDGATFAGRHYATAGVDLTPRPVRDGGPPVWIGSWGSEAGLRRVARAGDGWLASAYNITPSAFVERRARLDALLRDRQRDPTTFPAVLATAFVHVCDSVDEGRGVLRTQVMGAIKRPEAELHERLLIGTADQVVDKLRAWEATGVDEVLLWPVGDELAQLERVHAEVVPRLA